MNTAEEARSTKRSEKVAAMKKEAEKYGEAWAHVKTRSEDSLEKHRIIAQALLGTCGSYDDPVARGGLRDSAVSTPSLRV